MAARLDQGRVYWTFYLFEIGKILTESRLEEWSNRDYPERIPNHAMDSIGVDVFLGNLIS
jgi:hypothetical protein